jgi:transcriptional regulator NrdR family protein
MQCPECESPHTRVKTTENWGAFTKRYRECRDCGTRFWTVEVVELQPKKDTSTPHMR